MSAPAANDDPVERLVFECLERFATEGEAAIESVLASAPEHAVRVRAELDLLRRTGLLSPGSPVDAVPERLGEFRLLERLGGGGMGVVYRAIQEPLEREVALKLIRPEQLYFPGSRERFRREVLAVARLQHPAIVPVFTVGEASGIPYFAMERIDGETLADLLARLRGRDPATLRGADLRDESSATWSEACVRLVRAIAEALEHAHGRGVLHRDVKPSNIAVTLTGRGMLFDFGLASLGGGGALTRSGSQPGSLPYMSPEQVRGERELDARSDVYSLGVVLFEMLALRSPFAADASIGEALVSRAPTSPAPNLRELAPSTPRDLELVCRTALESQRERRYASAADFARDLGNVASHRPIEARRPGVGLRAVRWSQRHPALSAALLAAVVLSLAAGAFELHQQSVHGRELREQRDLAQRHFEEVRGVATSFLFDFHDAIKDLQGSTQARQLIVERALKLFEELAQAAEGDAQLQRDLAWAHVRLGQVLGDPMESSLGDTARAREQYELALGLYDALLRSAPEDVDLLYRRGFAGFDLAMLTEYDGDLERALALYAQWIDELGKLPPAARDNERITELLAGLHMNYSSALASANRLDDALATGRRALELWEQGADVAQDPRTRQFNLLGAHRNLSRVQRLRGEYADAEHELDVAVALTQAMLRNEPNSDSLQQVLAESRLSRGALLSALGRRGDALAELRSACDEFEPRRQREPRNAFVLRMLLTMRSAYTTELFNSGDAQAAIEQASAALELSRASRELGMDVEVELDTGDVLRALAEAQLQVGELAAALGTCTELVARLESDVARMPSHQALFDLARESLVFCDREIDELASEDGAPEAVAKVVAEQRALASGESGPGARDSAAELGLTAALLVQARVAATRNDAVVARTALEEAGATLEGLTSSPEIEVELAAQRVAALALQAQLAHRSDDRAGAIALCEKAVAWLERCRPGQFSAPRLEGVERAWRPMLIDVAQGLEREDLVASFQVGAQH